MTRLKSHFSSLQRKLLDAARGCSLGRNHRRKALRSFPLQSHQVRCSPGESPSQFHEQICRKIRNAKDRVYLASLYIGPAANPQATPKEAELLNSLASSQASSLKILLDQNRALRVVPTHHATTSSAEACREAIALRKRRMTGAGSPKDDLRLFSVLSPLHQMILPNPYNEVAGVFHIKCYIFDNEMVISGANLSEEYFTDRTDRYLWITGRSATSQQRIDDEDSTSPCLVQFYADLVEALCDYANPFPPKDVASNGAPRRSSSTELLERLQELLTVDEETVDDLECRSDLAAVAVPTIQAPQLNLGDIPSDHQVIQALLQAASASDIRLASAYLNPTDDMLQALSRSNRVHLLTAGHLSHGFKPKRNTSTTSMRTRYVPGMFDTLARHSIPQENSKIHLWYYQRPDWTFHAKGLWMSSPAAGDNHSLPEDSLLHAVTHGSGNYGYRSAMRDMESNLVLVLPEASPLQTAFRDEWNEWERYSYPAKEIQNKDPLPSPLRWSLPLVRRYL